MIYLGHYTTMCGSAWRPQDKIYWSTKYEPIEDEL